MADRVAVEGQEEQVGVYNDVIEQIEDIKSMFDGEVKEVTTGKAKVLKEAWKYIMEKYKPNHNIKPCIAYVLVNGIPDGWKRSAPFIAAECLRVYDGDKEKAWNLLRVMLKYNEEGRNRTKKNLSAALSWAIKKKQVRISCHRLSQYLPCVGSQIACYKIRGIKNGKREDGIKLLENQQNMYQKKFIEGQYYRKLKPKSQAIYNYLLNLHYKTGFTRIYVSYRKLAKSLGTKNLTIAPYLKELQKVGLISYKPGKKGRYSKVATEIELLDVTEVPEEETLKRLQDG